MNEKDCVCVYVSDRRETDFKKLIKIEMDQNKREIKRDKNAKCQTGYKIKREGDKRERGMKV